MDIGTTTGLSQFATHLFVKARHHRLACIVLHVFAIASGNGSTIGRTNAQHIDAHTLGLRLFGSLQGTTFMVFTISNDNDGLANTLLLGKAVGSHIDSGSDVCTLSSNHIWRDAAQEHLRTDIVAGDRQLDEGIASKDDESNLVVGEVVDQILDHHLRTVQTTGSHILSKH